MARKRNRGWFKTGFDERRPVGEKHRQISRKGFRAALCKHPHLIDWLMARFLTGRDARTLAQKERQDEPW